MEIDGELSAIDRDLVQTHLASCAKCRLRRRELENAIAAFTRLYALELTEPVRSFHRSTALAWAISLCLIASIGLGLWSVRTQQRHPTVVSLPLAALTPGATRSADRSEVCSAAEPNNRVVPAALRSRVFEKYGIPGADPQVYEIDYLVTPALGGAEDIRNLWPHSYSATVWNAKVKDQLEIKLRDLVCNGDLDLATAQREIAGNWIFAYKK